MSALNSVFSLQASSFAPRLSIFQQAKSYPCSPSSSLPLQSLFPLSLYIFYPPLSARSRSVSSFLSHTFSFSLFFSVFILSHFFSQAASLSLFLPFCLYVSLSFSMFCLAHIIFFSYPFSSLFVSFKPITLYFFLLVVSFENWFHFYSVLMLILTKKKRFFHICESCISIFWHSILS